MKVLQHNFTTTSLNIITKVIKSGELGFGKNVTIYENAFKLFSNKKHNIATNSASAAAYMIFAYLKERYGKCDVYVPSLTFTSPIWAANHFGHEIIFVDVNDDLLFDCNDYLLKRTNNNQTIVMPTLYGGVSTIDNWKLIGDEIVVVDSAHCPHPTISSDFVFTSFHPTKPICSPDGGMLSTNISDAAIYFKNYRNFGRETADTGYDITQNGFKFYMNNLSATIALESFRMYDVNLYTRIKNFNQIQNLFSGRFLKHDSNSSYYFATLISDDAEIIRQKYDIPINYPLLHKTKFYKNCSLPNIERLHSKILNLPLYDINIYNS